MSDYGVSISTSPSAITFASVRGSLESPSAVTAFSFHDGKAGDHRRCRVGVGDGGAPRLRGVESEDSIRRNCHRGCNPHTVAEEGCRASFLGGQDRRGHEGGIREAHGARFFLIGFNWRRRQ